MLKRSLVGTMHDRNLRHPDVAKILHGLAKLYDAQGRYAEAEPLDIRSLHINQNIHGNSHPDVTTVRTSFAVSLALQGKFDEAEGLQKRAMVDFDEAADTNHRLTAVLFNNLAIILQSQRRGVEAEPLFTQALGMTEKVLGPNDGIPEVAALLGNWCESTTKKRTFPPQSLS